MADTRNYRFPTEDDDPNVPVWMERLAEDVAADVTGIEELTPIHQDAAGLLVAITDADERRTFLEARSTDGGPTDWSLSLIRSRLNIPPSLDGDAGGILAAITDKDDRMTDLTVRLSDGQFPDWVVARLAGRLSQLLTISPAKSIVAKDKYLRGSEFLPVLTDSSKWAGWGSSSMQGINSYLAAAAGEHGASYYNGGKGGEKTHQIAARMGAIPAKVTVAGGSVPAAVEAVTVTSSNMPVNANLQSYTGTLAGIPGTLAYSATTAGYTFTRTTAGAVTAVPADTPFLPTIGPQYRGAVTYLWAGKNNFSALTPGLEAEVIAHTDTMADWLAPLVKRLIVLGHFADSNTSAGSEERRQILATNAAHAARYGENFIDVYAFITAPAIWARTGITPTQEDLDQQALGNKPPSLSSDGGHLNAAGYTAVRDYIKERIAALGWY